VSSTGSTPGLYAGTLRYLAPEAFSDEGLLDARSDVYSLGVTLFELTSGMPPFEGASESELIIKVVSESSPLLMCHPAAAAIARCALHKNPRERYRTAADMALDLDHLSQGATPLHAPPLEESGDSTQRFRNLLFGRAQVAAKKTTGSRRAGL
jgi:serine/threonine protein kinase